MSSETTNLHLVKPADNEAADIDVINGNMDIIDAALDYQTITEGIFTPVSGITVESQTAIVWGRLVLLELELKHTNAWVQYTQYSIGTVASALRPSITAGGNFHNSGVALLVNDGTIYVRPLGTSDLTAGASFSVRLTYLV